MLLAAGIAAALTPPRREPQPAARTAPGPAAEGAAASTVVATLPGRDASRPKLVRARVGDLLELTVRVSRPDTVELGGLGEVQAADPDTPASFSVVVDRTGRFDVLQLGTGRVLGRLELAAA